MAVIYPGKYKWEQRIHKRWKVLIRRRGLRGISEPEVRLEKSIGLSYEFEWV